MMVAFALDALLLFHGAFVLFVVGGGLLAMRFRKLLGWHLAAAAWGAVVEINGWICPLTFLEDWLRVATGVAGYQGGFLAHYLFAMIYPDGLSRRMQIGLGIGVVLVNAFVYGYLWPRLVRARRLKG
ncbi:DUF2784 domain-containing protein [Thiomonas sp. FB-Cd]|uniref:DUF2784 domain-containing protein n=1 Tax=Thiomonas sp. FB-Cd TaxID=1158292 RepID=UPI0004DFAB78|nr:DUF2784 domain-containing protein [Thiomonas sp. FB-Cd]